MIEPGLLLKDSRALDLFSTRSQLFTLQLRGRAGCDWLPVLPADRRWTYWDPEPEALVSPVL